MTKWKDMVFINGLTVLHTMVNGKKISWMVSALLPGVTDPATSGSSLKTRRKDEANTFGLMAGCMTESGSTENSMAMAATSKRIIRGKKVAGKAEK